MSGVTWLVGQMHVGASDGEVVREFAKRIDRAIRKGGSFTRKERREVYREALDAHHENQELYGFVMRGCRKGGGRAEGGEA